jgi:hypothetical protein
VALDGQTSKLLDHGTQGGWWFTLWCTGQQSSAHHPVASHLDALPASLISAAAALVQATRRRTWVACWRGAGWLLSSLPTCAGRLHRPTSSQQAAFEQVPHAVCMQQGLSSCMAVEWWGVCVLWDALLQLSGAGARTSSAAGRPWLFAGHYALEHRDLWFGLVVLRYNRSALMFSGPSCGITLALPSPLL